MFLPQPGPVQSWKYTFEAVVNFCVWTLKVDGLHVFPFNRHPAYKGPMQDAGLNPENWMQWFRRIILEQPQDPFQAWSITGLPPKLVEEQWESYIQQESLEERYNIFLQSSVKNFRQELEPYYTYLPTCTIFLVDYTDTVHLCFPTTAIISIPNKMFDEKLLEISLIQCLNQLGGLVGMPLNYKEAHQQKISILRHSLQNEIEMLPTKMQKQVISSLPKIDQLPVTVLEWLNARLQIFHILSIENEVEGIADHQETIANRQYTIINIRGIMLVVPIWEIQRMTHQTISAGRKISVHLLPTETGIINFSYILT